MYTKAHRIASERKQRSLAYFSEISSIFGTDKLFSVPYGPLLFLLFIKALAGGNYSVLLYVTWC